MQLNGKALGSATSTAKQTTATKRALGVTPGYLRPHRPASAPSSAWPFSSSHSILHFLGHICLSELLLHHCAGCPVALLRTRAQKRSSLHLAAAAGSPFRQLWSPSATVERPTCLLPLPGRLSRAALCAPLLLSLSPSPPRGTSLKLHRGLHSVLKSHFWSTSPRPSSDGGEKK